MVILLRIQVDRLMRIVVALVLIQRSNFKNKR